MRYLLLAAAVSVSVLAVGDAAAARSGSTAVVPACEQLLSVHQAELAMNEPHAFVLYRAVQGATRTCDYAGGTKGGVRHSLMVEWGPYADYRKQVGPFASSICAVSKTACAKLAAAVKLQPDSKSFAGLIAAVSQVGSEKRLRSPEYDMNPAVVWIPAKTLAPLDQLAWVFVYVVRSRSLVVGSCTDNTDTSPDVHCALAGAGWVFDNVT